MSTLSEQATKAALAQVQAERPSSFTVGGSFDGKTLMGGVTYDRTWANGWGLTAYARAWWDDLPVSVGRKKLQTAVGVEAVKRF